jgi:hypothetical protein
MVNAVGHRQPISAARDSEPKKQDVSNEGTPADERPERSEDRQSNDDLNTPAGGLDPRAQFDVSQGLRHKRNRDTGNTGDAGEQDGNTDSPDEIDTEGVTNAGGPGGVAGDTTNSTSEKPSPSQEESLDQWDPQIEEAAKSTGLPANFIKATLWAESRGNPNDPSQNPDGQHTDEGVMQISDYTYGDVMQNQPNAPRGMTAGNPADNIMMGAWELKDKLEQAGGDYVKTSMAYVGTGDAHEQEYANWVQTYWKELDAGSKLSDF